MKILCQKILPALCFEPATFRLALVFTLTRHPPVFFPALPVDEGIRFQLNIPPVVDICAPNFISTKELAAIKDEFGAKESKKGWFWNASSILGCV